MPDKLLELKNDLVFQELFGKPKNKEITSHFLSLILGREIFNVDLDANKRLLGNRPDSKTGRLDIRVKFNDGEDCNIELQVLPYKYMSERMLEYWAGMYSNKIDRGQGYNILKPSISILIADYNLEKLKDIPTYHTIWNLREEVYKDIILTDNIEMHILEIPKIKNNEILKDELVQWLKFIENPENTEVDKFMSENKYLKQAKEELAYLSGDPDFQRILEARVGFLRDMDAFQEQAREEGLAEGRAEEHAKGLAKLQKEKLEIAKKLLKLKIPINQIIIATGLSKEEVEML